MGRVLTRLFSTYGLYSFAYTSDQLCAGVHCSWECSYWGFLEVALFFDKRGRDLYIEENEHANGVSQSVARFQ